MVIFMFFGAPIVVIAGWYLFRGLGSGGGDDTKK
jgi:hypothetical protein